MGLRVGELMLRQIPQTELNCESLEIDATCALHDTYRLIFLGINVETSFKMVDPNTNLDE